MKSLREIFLTPLFFRTPDGKSEDYGEGQVCWTRRASLRVAAAIISFVLLLGIVIFTAPRAPVYPLEWVHHGVLLKESDCIIRLLQGENGLKRVLYCPWSMCEFRKDENGDGFHEVYCLDLERLPVEGV